MHLGARRTTAKLYQRELYIDERHRHRWVQSDCQHSIARHPTDDRLPLMYLPIHVPGSGQREARPQLVAPSADSLMSSPAE
jgi:hypothetical protein